MKNIKIKSILLGVCLLFSSSIFAYNTQCYQPNTYNYYDEWGRQQGSAKENWKGEIEYYDEWDRQQGTARPSFDKKGYDYYDDWGTKQGSIRSNDLFVY